MLNVSVVDSETITFAFINIFLVSYVSLAQINYEVLNFDYFMCRRDQGRLL